MTIAEEAQYLRPHSLSQLYSIAAMIDDAAV